MKTKLTRAHLKEHLLTILTISAVILGVVVGIICRAVALEKEGDEFKRRTVMYVGFIGDIFLRILKSLIIPLIVSSLISAVGSLDISLSKRIGTRAIAYYLLTTVMAVVLGIILVTTIRPGVGGESSVGSNVKPKTRPITTPDTMLDLLR